ncbi:MAG: hypothetical protein M1819_005472 [Sarea resinae]|nr:MAG: hypothetical protein M1819_005472 [Sarea resinae]
MGVEIKPSNVFHEPTANPTLDWNHSNANNNAPIWTAGGTPGPASNGNMVNYNAQAPGATNQRSQETNLFRALPVFRAGCNGDNYLGVSSGNSFLSPIRGTALSVLGMEIDLADFSSSDVDEPDPSVFQPDLYNKSYQSFLQSALNVNQRIEKVDLPSKIEGITYADWYFRVMNSYLPVLHKPTFMALLARIYDDPDFRPSPAELVMVHMMFAIMFFQYASRNWEDSSQQSDLHYRSNQHYHYALGFFYQLIANHSLQDVQALALLCAHLRNFPKPGASWVVTNMTLTLAIELGLHRSSKRWAQTNPVRNILEIEMRKRVFWSILLIHVTISGKLGRPMALRAEDFDVELPEAVDDELLSEAGIDTSREGKCAFRVGIEAFKLHPLFMELYSNIYAVKRSPQTYIETVRRLETKLQKWREQLPLELIQESGSEKQEERVFAVYIETWALEFRLLLHHPALSLTMSPEFNNENLDVCLECAQAMLHSVQQLRKYKSLDTTWYNGAVYLMAITSSLFGHWERRDQITAAGLSSLRAEMGQWLDIMGDVGGLLGSGKRLQDAVRIVIDGTVGMLSRNLATKTASAAVASANLDRSPSHSPNQGPPQSINTGYVNQGNFSAPFQSPNNHSDSSMNNASRSGSFLPADDASINQAQTPYPATTQYSYPEPSTSALSSYPANPNPFESSPYPNAVENPVNAASTPQASANAFIFQNGGNSSGNYSSNPAAGGSQSWRQWTGTMAGNLEPQEYLNSASALMQLGGRDLNQSEASQGGAPVADMTGSITGENVSGGSAMSGAPGQPWPLMIFDMGTGNQ